MSYEYIDRLSDVELHNKLIQCGFANTPVTETTRKILIKKLKNHMKNDKTKRRKSNNPVYNSQCDNHVANGHDYSSGYLRDSDLSLTPQRLNCAAAYTTTTAAAYPYSARTTSNYYSNTPPQSTKSLETSPKMYVPSPNMPSDSENDSDSFYQASNVRRKLPPMSCGIDTSKYMIPNGVLTDNTDGGVVSRLLNLRDTTLQKKYKKQITYAVDESKTFKGNHQPNRIKARRTFSWLRPNLKWKLEFNHTYIPYVLIGAFVIFFIIIAYAYMSKRNYLLNIIDENTTHYNLCSTESNQISDVSVEAATNCLTTSTLNSALEIYKKLVYILQSRAENHHCVDPKHELAISHTELQQNLFQSNNAFQDKVVRAVKYLIAENPQWKIVMMNMEGEIINKFDMNVAEQENFMFALINPNIPWKCVWFNKIQKFFFIVGTITILGVAIVAAYALYKYIRNWKKNQLLLIDHYVTEILNEVQLKFTEAEGTESGREVFISHLRDKLIPIFKRNANSNAWNEALRLLDEKESRVQFGIAMCNGEEFRTIKWIGGVDVRNGTGGEHKKKWQSSAFDNTNKIVNPPTPCLKIRHMFDTSEVHQPNLKQSIFDAILEKVGPNCKICDIQLDKDSCCVYLRCASEADAGMIHNEINGWWFDKRLISIKFLRLQRYLNRFPKSSNMSSWFNFKKL